MLIASAALLLLAAAFGFALRAGAAGSPSGDWTSFGRTPDNLRHSPLTQITKSNVDKLGRVVNLDLRKADPSVRRGQQSYPRAIDGTLYMTTNNDYVMAIDGATGDVKWTYKPANSGVFANFGVAVLSPLGPIGIDLGYGFDKVTATGKPDPGWQLHFKLGQFF